VIFMGLNEKGQIFSVDMIVASVVFLFILTLIIVFSGDISNRVSLVQEHNLREEAALHAASSLVYSPGSPANWENVSDLNNVSSIGIAETRNLIDSDKLARLVDLNQTNYVGVKDLLGLSKYDLKIDLIRMQNSQVISEFGLNPDVNKSVTTANRFAYYNNENVILRVKVFE